MNQQIAVIISRGIIDLEVETLSYLQNIIFNPKGMGEKTMLPIWTCLWLLLLTYRDTNEHWCSQKSSNDGIPELSQHMYEMLISIYSGIFGISSPARLNWLKADIFELFGKDYRVAERMGNLKSEMLCRCKSYEPYIRISYSLSLTWDS